MEGVGQPDRFILDELPTRIKSAYVVAGVPRQKSVLSPLNFLLKSLAVVEFSSFSIGVQIVDSKEIEKEQPEADRYLPTSPICFHETIHLEAELFLLD